jgi:pimeloyl-ACP methyl ester carboxylesterase
VVAKEPIALPPNYVQVNDLSPQDTLMPWNLPLKTTGGLQFWTDHGWRLGYRLQRNVITGHWRLLDASNVRRAWGTRDECQRELDKRVPKSSFPPAQHYVILLHGLMRTVNSMSDLEKEFRKAGKVEVVRWGYASSRESLSSHAIALREVLEGMPSDASFSFVGHSMGNIVTRHLIGDLQRNGDSHGILVRCRSMVMLGPPNQGASIARLLAPTRVFGWVTGPGGLELGANWSEVSDRLAIPPFPFLIIAGETKVAGYSNPMVGGDGDFILAVEETDLKGAVRTEIVPELHSLIMQDALVIQTTVAFIQQHAPATESK